MGKLYDIVILTDKRYLNDSATDTYIKNVFYEDQLVQSALSNIGLKVTRLAWDDSTFNWSNTAAVLFRSTWDYFDRFDAFFKWIERISKVTRLINSSELIHWNIDKHYLEDLNKKGVHTAETHFISKGYKGTLKDLHKELGWEISVLKPCISGAGRHTYKLTPDTMDTQEATFKRLLEQESMMLQPFQKNILSYGEVSLMLFNGNFTHAVLKTAKPGDFRVQDDFGGQVEKYTPSTDEINFANYCISVCPETPTYARVDIFRDNNNDLALAELELIEPELWFRNCSKAATIFAQAIVSKLVLN